jgi:hypothetical protein
VVNPEQVRFLSPCLAVSNQPRRYQGKTTYLYLRIIESLIEGRPFLYQTKSGSIYHVAENGVKAVESSWPLEKRIVAFVDGDGEDSKPKDIIRRSSVQIIVTSSPKGVNHKWTRQGGVSTIVTKLAIKLWSSHELFLTGLVLAFLLPTLD